MHKKPKAACFRAYDEIKAKIICNELPSGMKLGEIELAQDLGISRTPIREALIMLEKDDLVTRDDYTRGFYVKKYTLKYAMDLYQFRELIELYQAEKVISDHTAKDLEALEEILSDVQRLIDQNKPADALVRAVDFHLYIHSISCSNDHIYKALQNCYEKLIIICWSCQSIGACNSSAAEHEQIMRALRQRNLNKFREAISIHIFKARDRILDILRNETQRLYFS